MTNPVPENDGAVISWSNGRDYALEVHEQWWRLLQSGQKTIEIRAYPLPDVLLGRCIYILPSRPLEQQQQSGEAKNNNNDVGLDRLRSIPKSPYEYLVNLKDHQLGGWCVFSHIIEYRTEQDFRNDQSLHGVEPGDYWDWDDEVTDRLYGWKVSNVGVHDSRMPLFQYAKRQMRSLFLLTTESTF